ncbi:sigma-54 dependent transcriptional regulator [uncultured Paludibaculum sp.]|uniref:sigma-54-dependent transcriptional regulator n=1 Tax=uncultured Paludibaculum sp. TaxID=1765020 RepID=UPI002AAB4BEF|nr:sigma-54 dependent transcriptional regulator [uncultured Paludibaculum sp.]
MTAQRILLVDDDANLRWVVQTQLEDSGYTVLTAGSAEEAQTIAANDPPALVLTDLRMPGQSGLDLLRNLRETNPDLPVVIITAFGTIQNAVEAVKSGAYDYLTKPIDFEELNLLVRRALEHSRLIEEVRTLRTNLDRKYGFESIIGQSETLLTVLDMASRAAQTNSTILIRAETGTGKELLARAIHQNSPRNQRAFVTINCGAIPRDLLESELFGHVKGSFTGAIAHQQGKVELANGGTLFLDEIGELPMEVQAKLLRLIQQGEIEKVGAPTASRVDVRIIAATHRNLQAMIEDAAFREDLYYRLAVIPLELPPLRERSEDIPELVQNFFLKSKEKVGRPDLILPERLIPFFQSYRWPGNIRELENIVERIVVLSRGNTITEEDLPEMLRKARPAAAAVSLDLPVQGLSLDSVEKELIVKALEMSSWNQTHAARYLDISRKTLIYRMEKHGIRRKGTDSAALERA